MNKEFSSLSCQFVEQYPTVVQNGEFKLANTVLNTCSILILSSIYLFLYIYKSVCKYTNTIWKPKLPLKIC